MFPHCITTMIEGFNHSVFHGDYFLLHFDVCSPYMQASSLWRIMNNISGKLGKFCVFNWIIIEVLSSLCLIFLNRFVQIFNIYAGEMTQ